MADGTVVLSCKEPVSLTQKLAYQYKNYTGQEKTWHFFTLGNRSYRFPPGKCHFIKYDEVTEEKRLQLFGQIDLPVFTGTVCCREYLPVDAKYDEKSASVLLSHKLEKIIAGLEEKGVQIIQKDVKIVRKADALVLEGYLLVQEEAVLLKPAADSTEAETQTQAP